MSKKDGPDPELVDLFETIEREKQMVGNPNDDPLVLGHKIGMNSAVALARSGNLRLVPIIFEYGKYPYTIKFRPLKLTFCIWKQWWHERKIKRAESG